MKKFSLLLMIVLIVGAIFVSCSAEPSADATKVATVALSLDTAKELQVYTEVETLPQASGLYWFYTATKNDSDFKTGETGNVKTPLWGGGNMVPGLPSRIGEKPNDNNNTSGTWFSTGKWIFSFYGYKLPDLSAENNVLVYQKEGYELTVVPATLVNSIGATASIELTLANDTRHGSTIKMATGSENPALSLISVDLGNAYDSSATYKLTAYVDGEAVSANITTANPSGTVLNFSCNDPLITYSRPDNKLHRVEFKLTKGDETVYASGSIGLVARMGYTYTISGNLDSLESVAQVAISVTSIPTDISLTISSEEELRDFASYVNQGNNCEGMTIVLTKDITLSEPWTPIGNSYRGQVGENVPYFAGTFDGQGHTISGLELATDANVAKDSKNEYVFGLFGVVKNATIKNLKMTNVEINQVSGGVLGENVAAVVGYSEGSLTLDNITVGAASEDDSYINGQHVAGIISRAYGKTEGAVISITNCTNYATITATNGSDDKAKAAGIAAFVNPSHANASVTITGCTNNGAISSSASVHVIAAGIASYGFSSNEGNYNGTNQNESITISGNNIAQTATVSVTSDAENTRQSVDRISVNCGSAADSTDTEATQHGNN